MTAIAHNLSSDITADDFMIERVVKSGHIALCLTGKAFKYAVPLICIAATVLGDQSTLTSVFTAVSSYFSMSALNAVLVSSLTTSANRQQAAWCTRNPNEGETESTLSYLKHELTEPLRFFTGPADTLSL